VYQNIVEIDVDNNDVQNGGGGKDEAR